MPTNCLSLFGHFVGLALKRLMLALAFYCHSLNISSFRLKIDWMLVFPHSQCSAIFLLSNLGLLWLSLTGSTFSCKVKYFLFVDTQCALNLNTTKLLNVCTQNANEITILTCYLIIFFVCLNSVWKLTRIQIYSGWRIERKKLCFDLGCVNTLLNSKIKICFVYKLTNCY